MVLLAEPALFDSPFGPQPGEARADVLEVTEEFTQVGIIVGAHCSSQVGDGIGLEVVDLNVGLAYPAGLATARSRRRSTGQRHARWYMVWKGGSSGWCLSGHEVEVVALLVRRRPQGRATRLRAPAWEGLVARPCSWRTR